MKHPSHLPHELDPKGTLTPTEFNAGVDLWQTIRDANGSDLVNCLLAPGAKTRLAGLAFPVMQIVELVSAVGVQSIRARFVVLRDKQQNPHLSVAMYAVGFNDTVLSAYYLAERYWEKSGADMVCLASPCLDRDAPKHALPKVLADYWVANWKDTTTYPTSAVLFKSAGAPLNGYNFAVSDLMDPLRGLNNLGGQVLAMIFGLHTFLNFNGTVNAPVATLGLLLQMSNYSDKDTNVGDDAYDIAVPSPPGP